MRRTRPRRESLPNVSPAALAEPAGFGRGGWPLGDHDGLTRMITEEPGVKATARSSRSVKHLELCWRGPIEQPSSHVINTSLTPQRTPIVDSPSPGNLANGCLSNSSGNKETRAGDSRRR